MSFLLCIGVLLFNVCFAQEPKLMLPLAHTSRISGIDFSPDGKRFVTTSNDYSAKIWEANSGLLLANLLGQNGVVKSAEYSPDGKRIVTVSMLDNTAILWDAYTGELLSRLNEYSYVVAGGSLAEASFSPDSKKIVTCYLDSIAKIWDAKTGEFIVDLKGRNARFYTAQFSPDCKQIITTGSDSIVNIWDVFSGNLINNFSGQIKSSRLAKFSPDGKKILTKLGLFVNLWDAKTGELLITIKHNTEVNSVQFSPEGKRIVTVSKSDSTAKIYDVNTGAFITELRGHSASVSSALFSQDGANIVTNSFDDLKGDSHDNSAKIWNAITGNLIADFKGIIGFLPNTRISPDGNKLAVICGENNRSVNLIRLWDIKSGRLDFEIGKNTPKTSAVAFTPDSKNLILSSAQTKIWDINSGVLSSSLEGRFETLNSDGTLIITKGKIGNNFSIWRTINGSLVKEFKDVEVADFIPGGNNIAVSTIHDTTTHLWDIYNGQELMKLKGVVSAISPNGNKIITESPDSIAKIWDINSGILLAEINNFPPNYYAAEFSADGSKLLVFPNGPNSNRNKDYTPKLWDAASGKLVAELKKQILPITVAHFSPDGKKIVTGSIDGIVDVWESISGEFIAEIKGHTLMVDCAHFSDDSKRIITSSIDNTTKIWDSQTGMEIKNFAGRSFGFDYGRISSYGKKILTLNGDSNISLWDSLTGNMLVNLKGYATNIDKAQFSPDGKRVVSSSYQGINNIWDTETGELLYTLFNIDSADYLVIDKNNRYDGTEKARKLLYFTCGTEVIELDQVKDQLWVPNLAERLMKGDSINAKTLDQLNICGLTPLVEDASNKENGYLFRITSRRGGLGETVLFVNGIEAKRYKPSQLLKVNDQYELRLKKQELTPYFIAGRKNPITVKAYTSNNGISSRGVIIQVDQSKELTSPPSLYAVMVGVSDYKGTELDLAYAAKDATDISSTIANTAKKLLNTADGKEHVFMYNLTTAADHYRLPEKNSIKKVLEEIGKKASANDILLIFFAGHGVMTGEADKKQFYFLTADASMASITGAITEVGISTSELTEWMKPQNIKAQKRILIFDACNSGQAINDFVKMGKDGQEYVAARNDDKTQLIKAIDKLNEKSGLFILSASATNQSAYEMGRYSQGLLTYSLLKAIKQQPDILNQGKYLDVSRWFNAAKESVSELAKEGGARQEPQIVSNTNFNIGIVDEDVIAKIILPAEKPLFASCNFQNEDENILADDLGLNKLIDQHLNEIAARGIEASITYVPGSNSPDAFTLSGRYMVSGNIISIKVIIRQNNVIKHKMDLTGTKDKLKEFTALIATQTTEWVSKNK